MSSKTLTNYLSHIKSETDKILEQFYNERISRASKLDPSYKQLVTTISRQTLRGGKRMRPSLAFLSYKIAGGENDNAMLRAGSALEIFHNYLLIHDDIMDRDDKRHGGLNVSGIYKNKLKNTIEKSQVESTAHSISIIAGDINCGLSYEALLESGFDSQTTIAAIDRLNHAVFEVAAGQHLDILNSHKSNPNLRQILKIDQYKTAGYSLVMPLQFGAICAGNNSDLVHHFAAYGQAIGIAFQLADDILGMYGSEKKLGKPVISDLREGKQTVLIYYGMQLSSPSQKKQLQMLLKNPNSTIEDLRKVRKILDDCGAKAKTLVLAHDLLQQALEVVDKITTNPEFKQLLIDLAYYCVERKK